MKRSTPASEKPIRLKRDRKFQPCPAVDGDELYPNGIFVFNITRMLAHIEARPEKFSIERVELTKIPRFGDASDLDQETVRTTDLFRPILMAKISPGRYNLIDGHPRVARARREGVVTLPARRVRCPEHPPFLISVKACDSYVEYWNSKVKDWSPPPEGWA